MSTNPPSMPSYAPQGAPLRKKTSPIVWILVGLGVFFLLVVLVVVGAGYFVVSKARQAGIDTDLMKHNPALASVKMMAALNPNIEVLSLDDSKGIVTVRDKKSGKTYSVNFEDARRGRFVMQEDGKTPVTITSSGDGNAGTLEIKSADGTMKIGGGAGAKVPTWVPEYPGSTPEGAFAAQTDEGNSGSYTFKTRDSIAAVTKVYEEGFRSMGLKTTSTLTNADGKTGGGIVSAQADRRSAVVMVGSEDGETTVSVTFKSKK